MEVVNVTGPLPPQGHNPDGLLLVGCGTMAGAMVEGWRAAGYETEVVRPHLPPEN